MIYPLEERDPDEALERQRALEDWIVDMAFRDILSGRLDSEAVHEVMQRRAGSMEDYRKAKDLADAAALAARHCGVA